jgi:hypothetical protein
MTPDAKTTLYPTSAEAVTSFPSAVWATPSAIWADTGGTITVIPFDSQNDASVAFTIPNASVVPVMVKKVVSIGTAAGIKRIY